MPLPVGLRYAVVLRQLVDGAPVLKGGHELSRIGEIGFGVGVPRVYACVLYGIEYRRAVDRPVRCPLVLQREAASVYLYHVNSF